MPTFVGMTRTTDWFRTLASGVRAYQDGAGGSWQRDTESRRSGIGGVRRTDGLLSNPRLGLGFVHKPWRPPSRPVCAGNQHDEPARAAQDLVAIHNVP